MSFHNGFYISLTTCLIVFQNNNKPEIFSTKMEDTKLNAFKEALKRSIDRNKGPIKSDDEYFAEEFRKVNLSDSEPLKNGDILPKLYSGLPPEDNDLKQKLREEARAQFLQRRSRSLLDNEELKKLYSTLESHSVSPEENLVSLCEDNLMDYESFLKAKDASSSKCQQYFKVRMITKL